MNTDLYTRLREIDSDEHWESPPGFDYFRGIGEVFCYQLTIEHILKQKLTIDRDVQDAAYFTELAAYDPRFYDPIKGGQMIETISIRFSAFDRMVTIFGTEASKFQEKIPALIDFLVSKDFRYVSYSDLNVKYEGKVTHGTDGWTWFTRFFDYL